MDYCAFCWFQRPEIYALPSNFTPYHGPLSGGTIIVFVGVFLNNPSWIKVGNTYDCLLNHTIKWVHCDKYVSQSCVGEVEANDAAIKAPMNTKVAVSQYRLGLVGFSTVYVRVELRLVLGLGLCFRVSTTILCPFYRHFSVSGRFVRRHLANTAALAPCVGETEIIWFCVYIACWMFVKQIHFKLDSMHWFFTGFFGRPLLLIYLRTATPT